MPSSSGYTYNFGAGGVNVLGKFEAPGGVTYIRMPGMVRFENLDPEIDLKALQNPPSATLAKYWTASIFLDNDNYEYYKNKIKQWYELPPEQQGVFPKFPDPSTAKDQYFLYLDTQVFGPDIYALTDSLWSYAGGAWYELPFSSKFSSASLNISKLNTLTGINFNQSTTTANSGITTVSTGINRGASSNSGASGSITQNRYGSADSMEGRMLSSGMLNTSGSTSTAPLPSTVLVAVRSSLSGDFQTATAEYLPVNLPPNTKATNYAAIREAVSKAMVAKGFSTAEVLKWLTDNKKPKVVILPDNFGKSGGSRGGGNKNSEKVVSFGITPTPEVNKKVIVRFGRSYRLPEQIDKTQDARPMMIQWITNSPIRTATDFKNGKSIREEDRIVWDEATGRLIKWATQEATLKYVFPYIPTDIQYTSLGAQWTEVPRTKNVPYVDFQGFQRMKVSFSFIISSTRVEPGNAVVPDGLYTSVDEQITLLRKMYQSKQPVTIYNMDSMLSNSVDRLNNNPVQFVIVDLGIEAVRRQEGSPSHITTAQCSITLNEIIVENAVLIRLSPPTFDEFIPRGGGGGGGTANRPDLWTKYLPAPTTSSLSQNAQMIIDGGSGQNANGT